MSVFSKIFIVINLLLTLLLVAATATQISLKGVYKTQYKKNHQGWLSVKEQLASTKSDYEAQTKTLKRQAGGRKDMLSSQKEKLSKAQNERRQSETKRAELQSKKVGLVKEIEESNRVYKSKTLEIKGQRNELEAARKKRASLWERTRRGVITWYALQQAIGDLENELKTWEVK